MADWTDSFPFFRLEFWQQWWSPASAGFLCGTCGVLLFFFCWVLYYATILPTVVHDKPLRLLDLLAWNWPSTVAKYYQMQKENPSLAFWWRVLRRCFLLSVMMIAVSWVLLCLA